VDALEARARALESRTAELELDVRAAPGKGVVGGGTYPGVELPTWTLVVKREGLSPHFLAASLRGQTPPVVARVEDDTLVLDLRTVAEAEDDTLLAALNTLERARF
jgi:L-seryl-tRNA(Ser) seleniumtransferase